MGLVNGIFVKNFFGTPWVPYGDKTFFVLNVGAKHSVSVVPTPTKYKGGS
jgi:hypothetical protein